jgi:glycosyltransferase involved in cell wall biosynthesis
MKHFLTFILPCYNYADIIEQSLASIYQQVNLKVPFEVICTDDCSTDEKTRDILRDWTFRYSNFYSYFRRETGGECVANNLSISRSQGDLIFCLDTDNVLVPNSVQGLIDLLDEVGCEGASFQKLQYFKELKHRSYRRTNSWVFESPNNIIDIYHICSTGMTPASSGNYLFTRESYDRAGGYPEGNVMGSWSFGFRQHATGSRIVILPGTFYWHRFSKGGMYLSNEKKGLNSIAVSKTAREFPEIYTRETWELMQKEEYKNDFFKLMRSGLVKLKEGL